MCARHLRDPSATDVCVVSPERRMFIFCALNTVGFFPLLDVFLNVTLMYDAEIYTECATDCQRNAAASKTSLLYKILIQLKINTLFELCKNVNL